MSHPVKVLPGRPADERLERLEQNLACLWDQVWWMRLPFWKRWLYRLQGYSAPIADFYPEEW